ncbi:TPA: hypothetical protein ACKP22_004435, partial [Pseudomonas putida]
QPATLTFPSPICLCWRFGYNPQSFQPVAGQSDQRLKRIRVLWLLNNDHKKPALKNKKHLGQPQAPLRSTDWK